MLEIIKKLIETISKKKTPFWWLSYSRILASGIFMAVYVMWQEGVIYPTNELSIFSQSMLSALVHHANWLKNENALWILLFGLLILSMSGFLARFFNALKHSKSVDEAYTIGLARWNTFFDFAEIVYTFYYLFIAFVFCSLWVLKGDLFLFKKNIQNITFFAGFHLVIYAFLRIYKSEISRCEKACRFCRDSDLVYTLSNDISLF